MKTWYGIDLFKIIAAVLVVFNHTYNFDMGHTGAWIKDVLTPACVPFFFIASGFFFRRGMERSHAAGGDDSERIWFNGYIMRLVKMYIGWSLLTIPVGIMTVNLGHPEFGPGLKLLYHLRMFFFSGSLGVYWYVLALILSASIIRWCSSRRLLAVLSVVSIALFLLGCEFARSLHSGQPVFDFIHIVFGTERNFLNMGLFYTLIGFLYPVKWTNGRPTSWKCLCIILFIASIAFRTMEMKASGIVVSQAFVALSAFMLATAFDYAPLSGVSLGMRLLSIGIYLIHFPFILVFDFYLKRGTAVDFPVTLLFSAAVFCLLYYIFPKLSAILFGYSRQARRTVTAG